MEPDIDNPEIAWTVDILRSASDLGYGVKSLGIRSVVLVHRRSGVKVAIKGSPLLSGALIRDLLRAAP